MYISFSIIRVEIHLIFPAKSGVAGKWPYDDKQWSMQGNQSRGFKVMTGLIGQEFSKICKRFLKKIAKMHERTNISLISIWHLN